MTTHVVTVVLALELTMVVAELVDRGSKYILHAYYKRSQETRQRGRVR